MSKKNKPSTDETYTNSTCRDLGHKWMSTTSDTYRKCCRNTCKAAQRLVNGQWVNVVQEKPWQDPRAEWAKRQAMPKQIALF
jgi:hypothetical protein